MKTAIQQVEADLINKKEPRGYRLDVGMPRPLSAKLEKLVKSFKDKGVKTTKSEVVVIILQQFFDRVDDES